MRESNLGRKCKFANECSIFKGEENPKGAPLTIYRNVFCNNNGKKGWRNCERYLDGCYFLNNETV